MRKVVSVLVVVLALGCVNAYAQQTGRPLSEALDSTGRIRPGIFSSSFYASGYKMRLAKDGSPTFTSSPLDTNWDSRFETLGMNSSVRAIAISGSDVYVGGHFTMVGGDSVNHIAKWNGTSWSALGSGVDSSVYALAVCGNDLYAGGNFTMAGGVGVNFIAKWNGSTWSPLGEGVSGTWHYYVYAIAANDSDVYVGGPFIVAGGVLANGIAKWNGSSWSALGSGVDGYILAIAVSGSTVYAGGWFSTAGGVSARNIAKWNGTDWSALGNGVGGGGADVECISVSGDDVYAGGQFTGAGGDSANYIAKWNGTSWSTLGSGMNGYVLALDAKGSNVYAGGLFDSSDGVSTKGIAKWNGSSWSALGSGVDGFINAITVRDTDAYVGGYFTTAGGKPSYCFGIYHDGTTGIEGKPGEPLTFNSQKLEQNKPNPFNQRTTINYQLPQVGQVSLKVYNISGQLVKTLVNKPQNTGAYNVTWDGKDEVGKRVSTGLYFYRLNAADVNEVKRLVLVK